MAVIGHGVDLVLVARIASSIAEHGQRFIDRVYTKGEQAECVAGGLEALTAPQRARAMRRLAARFAAKEAAMKALGTGLADGISWQDIEIVNLATGQPTLMVTGRAEQLATQRGIAHWHVSLSDQDYWAIASVIAEG